jgi:hypothetical protein
MKNCPFQLCLIKHSCTGILTEKFYILSYTHSFHVQTMSHSSTQIDGIKCHLSVSWAIIKSYGRHRRSQNTVSWTCYEIMHKWNNLPHYTYLSNTELPSRYCYCALLALTSLQAEQTVLTPSLPPHEGPCTHYSLRWSQPCPVCVAHCHVLKCTAYEKANTFFYTIFIIYLYFLSTSSIRI